MTSTSPPKKASTQRTTRNQYSQEIQVPTTVWYHHWNTNTTVSPLGHTTTSQTTTTRHESESTTPPHGTDYWLMMSVSNPNNTTQELHLSLAVTDVRSNCHSTTQVQTKNCGDQPNHHNLQLTHPASPCLASLETLA
ncbi:hypothetical protein Taro_024667 [Colocasia esculenta]|uniref:Uncharacterized protein n=1 Tax=Colocasia esculenta TaxID=4460 RepID=A0A843V7D7_COLES|nr:hypothetical protein [Colocasia esculenta]